MTPEEFGSSEAGKKGGKARAEKLTPQQRSAIARNAALVKWEKEGKPPRPRATHRGMLNIGEAIEIPCYVLDDGTRVISGRGMTAAIGMKGRGQGMQRIARHRAVNPYMDNDLRLAIENPITIDDGGGPNMPAPQCFEATVLLQICEAIQRAGEDGLLKTDQEKRYAKFCGALIRSFTRVGIIALVDEATGYERDKKQNDLARILAAFVAKELQPWLPTFDLEFYELICELRNEPISRVEARPPYFGKITNNLVYERLAPGVLQVLKEKNPVLENGRRKHKHHQHLTPDLGHPKLKEHLAGVTTAMKFAKLQGISWEAFLKLLNKTHPKYRPMPLFDKQDGAVIS